MIWKPITFLSALLLSIISIALPVMHWASIPSELLPKVIAGLTAFSLSACKLAFFPLSWQHFAKQHLVSGLTLFLFGCLLLVVSVDATRDLLKNQSDAHINLNQNENLQHKNLKIRLIDLNQEISTFQALINSDQLTSYRGRAYSESQKLQTLKNERISLLGHLEELSQSQLNQPQARFGFSLGTSESNKGLAVTPLVESELLTAILIHLCCIVSVLACTVWRIDKQIITTRKTDAKLTKRLNGTNEPTTHLKKTDHENENELSLEGWLKSDQLDLLEKISLGEFGSRPGPKAIVESNIIQGGFNRVKPVFDIMINQGKLIKKGRFYFLT